MVFRIRIRKHEIGLRFRHGELQEVLRPGAYFNWNLDHIRICDRLQTEFKDKLLDVLLTDAELRKLLHVVDLADSQRAMVIKDDRLAYLLGPGRYAFWKEPAALSVETFDISDVRFQHPQLERILRNQDASKYLNAVRVEAHEKAIIYVNGELAEVFGPGVFAYWVGAGQVTWKSVDLREQVLDVAGQEIMTADKVTLRVNLLVTYRVTDPLQSVAVVHGAEQALYREAQLALRAAVGGRPLDKLLSDKETVANEVQKVAARRAGEFGVQVHSVGIRDVILPGEMKTILNQVIEAEKRAEANLIRRREETAAARSQANTAKLLAESPVLQRMKELEMLQDILAGTKATFVVGQGDLASQVRSMIGTQDE